MPREYDWDEEQLSTERPLPHSHDLEQKVLACLLLDATQMTLVADILGDTDFYEGKHQKLYATLLSMFQRDEPLDFTSVSDELSRQHLLDYIGGDGYVAEILTREAVGTSAPQYAERIREYAKRRELSQAASNISTEALNTAKPLDESLESLQNTLLSLNTPSVNEGFQPLSSTVTSLWRRVESAEEGPLSLGVATGLTQLDQMLDGGFKPGGLYILAARPSVGKTSMALSICYHIGVLRKEPVAIFSLESSRMELAERLLSMTANVNSWALRNGVLSDAERQQVVEACAKLDEAPIFIDDQSGLSIAQMRLRAKQIALRNDLKLIVVDYLQLAVSRRLENRVNEVSEVSQGLKGLAKDLDVPVLALSQLSRGVEHRTDNQPQLSDLRDSGSIEQDADVVMMLYRDSDSLTERQAREVVPLNMSIAKNRNGRVGLVQLEFIGSRTRVIERGIEHARTTPVED